MQETHICVVDRDGGLALEKKAKTSNRGNRGGVGEGTGV
jgi:hypothetical protein